jgi:hypothetical protein
VTTETTAAPADSAADAPPQPDRPETNPIRLRMLQGRYTGPTDTDGQLRLAAALARGKRAIPWQYRDNPGDVLAVIQHAMALDIQLAVAIDNLVFSDTGVGGMRARLMHALILRAGHTITVTHHDDRICRMVVKRADGHRGGGAQWTVAEAQRAGLFTKDRSPWHAYAQDMLWARCLSRLARRYCPDVIAGFYVAEELDDLPADALDAVDMSTPMTDANGDVVVAPDVEELMRDLDVATLDELRGKWKQAGEEGLMGVYAGTVDGVDLSVRDLLFARLADAEEKARAAENAAAVQPQDLGAIAAELNAANPTTAADAAANLENPAAAVQPPAADGDDAPAGSGKMACGCPAAAVLASDGRHGPRCERKRGRS